LNLMHAIRSVLPRYSWRWLETLGQVVDTAMRRRPRWMISFSIGNTSLSEGLRAACAATAMLILAQLLGRPDFAWAAIGAFWTCLADASGSNRMRLASMGGFALLSTLSGAVALYAAGHGLWAAAAAVLVLATLGAFGRIWGAAVAQVAILAATACVVMVDQPLQQPGAALTVLAVYLFGCLWATALSLTLWRIHPLAPSRAALARSYSELAQACRDTARLLAQPRFSRSEWSQHALASRSQVRVALELARTRLAKVPRAHAARNARYDALLLSLADAERIFGYLIAVADACERRRAQVPDPRRAGRALHALAEVLRQQAQALGHARVAQPHAAPAPASAPAPLSVQAHFQGLADKLDRALGESLRLALDVAGPKGVLSGPADSATAQLAAVLRSAWATLRQNLSWRSIGLRHAARCGVTTMLGYLLVHALHLPLGYWATMAILLILQPSVATTWPRGLERAAGSLAGGLIAVALGWFVHAPMLLALLVFPLVTATMAFSSVSYSLFVMFLTPTFVLVADFAAPDHGGWAYALARVEDNVLGCALALAATFLLWPSREPVKFIDRFAVAVAANLRYLANALGCLEAGSRAGDAQVLESLRREAGLASNNAEESLQRAQLESLQRSAAYQLAPTALALLRRLAGISTRAWMGRQASASAGELAQWLEAVHDVLLSGLRSGHLAARLPTPPQREYSAVERDAIECVALLGALIDELS
jgi:uncharacterized membrane protein YccC